jgi:hypothetical protein
LGYDIGEPFGKGVILARGLGINEKLLKFEITQQIRMKSRAAICVFHVEERVDISHLTQPFLLVEAEQAQ